MSNTTGWFGRFRSNDRRLRELELHAQINRQQIKTLTHEINTLTAWKTQAGKDLDVFMKNVGVLLGQVQQMNEDAYDAVLRLAQEQGVELPQITPKKDTI